MQTGGKQRLLRARVTNEHLARLAELEQATGLSTSQVVRTLIESARLEPRPMPVATLEEKHEGGVKVGSRAAALVEVRP